MEEVAVMMMGVMMLFGIPAMMAPLLVYPLYKWAGGKKSFFRWLKEI